MKKSLLLFIILFAFIMVFPLSSKAVAEEEEEKIEEILSFHSDITVHKDASMTVKETIKVIALGEKIKRGIYRDFPTKYKDRLGNRYVVGFEVKEVLRDGKPEPWHTDTISNGIRVYIGEKSVFIPSGEYTYTITYNTSRQLGFFKDFDELYWNVTGNGWEFQIDKASASIKLPDDASRKIVSSAGYTGPKGSTEENYTMRVDKSGIIHFAATRQFDSLEGLTIAVSWPKGYVTEPDARAKMGYFISDNMGTILGIIGLGILFLYYVVVWFRVGKDPEAGVIFPRYTPPDNMSPAVMRFITEMGYDDKIFASSVIDMAVKGTLKIKEDDGEYTLEKIEDSKSPLAPEERKILDNLFSSEKRIELKQSNHKRIRSSVESLKESLKLGYEKLYFVTNRWYFVAGLVISALLTFITGVGSASSGGNIPVFLFMSIWLTGWSFGVIMLLRMVIRAWRAVLGPWKILKAGSAIFITLFSLPFIGGEIAGSIFLATATSFYMIIFLLSYVLINFIFYHLLKAPTRTGRKILDAIDGFRVFLSATEKDRLNMLNPPEKTPELFEKYLPYALALDVEQQWSEQFSDILSAAAIEGTRYSPLWYSGRSWSSMAGSDFVSSFGSSLSSAISSSSTAPGSSSGSGGGGSSGGGGGGGGGGGW